jgi:hypothetical protein
MTDQRRFSWDDQRAFAELSGDWNPMHMDPQSARRTLAGACVVHGVQSLLWMLEQAAAQIPFAEVNRLEASFTQFLYLDEPVQVSVKRMTSAVQLDLRSGPSLISRCIVKFGRQPADEPMLAVTTGNRTLYPAEHDVPQDRSWEQLAGLEGDVPYATPPGLVEQAYPGLCAAIGPQRVTGILALTRLVGMVSPGLHSTFHRLAITVVDESLQGNTLRFVTTETVARFQLATLAVRAPGLAGIVTASRRSPPVSQPSCAELHDLTPLPEFHGHTALVIGGSRGLGELTAKLLALRGVNTLVTYASGQCDAEAVVADIRAAGRAAEALPFDVLAPLEAQLSRLPDRPTSLYFFATSRIAGRASSGYSPDRRQIFNRLYVDAFHNLCTSLTETCDHIDVFYPSSAFVATPTAGMVEYAMAKAAGEVLAADLTRFHPKITVEVARLPRLPTDQTNGIVAQELGSAVSWLRPLVDRIETRVVERLSSRLL